jgi:hypothetical protein
MASPVFQRSNAMRYPAPNHNTSYGQSSTPSNAPSNANANANANQRNPNQNAMLTMTGSQWHKYIKASSPEVDNTIEYIAWTWFYKNNDWVSNKVPAWMSVTKTVSKRDGQYNIRASTLKNGSMTPIQLSKEVKDAINDNKGIYVKVNMVTGEVETIEAIGPDEWQLFQPTKPARQGLRLPDELKGGRAKKAASKGSVQQAHNSGSYVRTQRKHVGKDGVERTVYTKGSNKYVKRKTASGYYTYERIDGRSR